MLNEEKLNIEATERKYTCYNVKDDNLKIVKIILISYI